jgi:hypothetical protein
MSIEYMFPNQARSDQPGCTLLDWYAGQALPYLLQHSLDAEKAARNAYQVAAAMMKERKKWVS